MTRDTREGLDTVSDVAIVGAGIAGLCAARRLSDAGCAVTVFEAKDDVGGEARPGWLVSGGDRAWLRFLDACGTRDEALAPALAFHVAPTGACVSSPTEGARPPRWPRNTPRLARFARLLGGMCRDLDLAAPERATRWDDRSVRDFADLYLGRRAAPEWFEPWLASRSPVDVGETSRVAALFAWTARRDAPVMVLRKAPTHRDRRWLGETRLRCGERVTGVEIRGGPAGRGAGDTKGRSVSLVLDGGSRRHRARVALLAVPPADLLSIGSALWSAPQRRALAALATLDVAFADLPLRETPRALRGDLSGRPALLRLTRTQSRRVASVLLELDPHPPRLRARMRGSEVPPNAALAAHLEALLPGLRAETDGLTTRVRPQAQFPVGAYRVIDRARRLAGEQRGLFVCGESWSEATLEGAAQSGWRAAGEALVFLRAACLSV